MPMNVNRWLKYAKAKLDDTLASGNEELDKREARREAERAERPWLASEADAPTFDEARTRIAWEADQAERDRRGDRPDAAPGRETEEGAPTDRPAPDTPASRPPTDPQSADEAAERSAAQIVLAQRAEESAARLAQIREELGVDDPGTPPT